MLAGRSSSSEAAREPDRGAGQLDDVLGLVDDEVGEVLVVVGDVRADGGDGLEPGDSEHFGVGHRWSSRSVVPVGVARVVLVGAVVLVGVVVLDGVVGVVARRTARG